MSENVGNLSVGIGGDPSGLEAALGRAQSSLDRFADRATAVGRDLSVRVTAPLAALGALSLSAFDKQAKAVAGVEVRLRRFGDAAEEMSARYQAEASKLQSVSLFGDEEILAGVTQQLLTFGNISGPVFDRAQRAALDLSTTLGQDLKSSSIQLGKALNDPLRGLTALQRVGITFSDSQEALVKSLQESGDLLGAQGVILKEIETFYGGAAEAAAAAGTGPFKQAANAIGDAFESIGGAVAATFAPLAGLVQSAAERFKVAFDGLSAPVQKAAVALAAFAAVVGPVVLFVGQAAKTFGIVKAALQSFYLAFGPVGVAVVAVGAALAVLLANFDTVRAFMEREMPGAVEAAVSAFEGVKGAVARAGAGVADALRPALSAAARLWRDHGDTVVRLLGDGLSAAVTVVGRVVEGVARVVSVLAAVVGPVLSGAIALAEAAFGSAGDRAGEFGAALTDATKPVRQAAAELATALRPALEAASAWWAEHRDNVARFSREALGFVRDAFGAVVRVVGATMSAFVSLTTAGLRYVTGDWDGATATVLAAAERIGPGVLDAFERTFEAVLTAVAGFGLAMERSFVGIGTALGKAISGPALRALEVVRGVAEQARALANAFPQDFAERFAFEGLTADDILAPDARAALSDLRETFTPGALAVPDLSGDTGKTAKEVRTVADVVKDLNERLALARERFTSGLSTAAEFARAKAQALAGAFDDAYGVVEGKLTPEVERLRDRARQAATVVLGLGRFKPRDLQFIGEASTADALRLDGVTRAIEAAGGAVDDLPPKFGRARAAVDQFYGAIRDVPVPDLSGLLDGVGLRAAQALRAARDAALDFADALATNVARALYRVGDALSLALFGDVEYDLSVLDAKDAIERLGEELREGTIDQARYNAEIAVAEERLRALEDAANPIKAAVGGIADAFKSAMADVVASITRALVKALALKAVLAVFGGPQASFASLFFGALGVGGGGQRTAPAASASVQAPPSLSGLSADLQALGASAAAAAARVSSATATLTAGLSSLSAGLTTGASAVALARVGPDRPAALPLAVAAAPPPVAYDLVTRQVGPPRLNPARGVLEIPVQTFGEMQRAYVQGERDRGAGDPYAGGVLRGL